MVFVRDVQAQSVTEHLAVVGLILTAAGAAVWLVYQAVADRFRDIANNL